MGRRIAVTAILLMGLAIPILMRPHDEWRSRKAAWTRDPNADIPCVEDKPVNNEVDNFFSDATDQLKIDFQQRVGPLGTYFMPEINGTGGALFDYDDDGDLDLLLVNSTNSPNAQGEFPETASIGNRLYRQDADGSFTDVTEGSGIEGGGYAVGCAVGDIDNDGDLDVFVAHYGQDRLYRNDGNGRFVEITNATLPEEQDYGTCAAFFDYDGDGWLDLIVVNYVHDPIYQFSIACASIQGRNSYCGPHKFSKTINRLYHNEGESAAPGGGRGTVRFRDVTAEAGLSEAANAGFAVVCGDFNRDGKQDFYIANDMAPKQLWINQGNGRFVDEAVLRGVAANRDGLSTGSMGLAMGDIDGDGAVDFVTTNLALEGSTLYLNNQSGIFKDVTRDKKLYNPTLKHTGWGVALYDFDHDGDLDLAQVNGFVVPCHSEFLPHGEDLFRKAAETITDPKAYWHDYSDDNLLLINRGDGVFVDESSRAATFSRTGLSARGLIAGDIDGDGDIDLVVTNCGERAHVFRNEMPKLGHWLQIRAIDPRLHRDAYGAELKIRAHGREYVRWINPAGGYLGSNDVRAHCGLGLAVKYDAVVVTWPDGLIEEFPGGEVDRSIVVTRGSGRLISAE